MRPTLFGATLLACLTLSACDATPFDPDGHFEPSRTATATGSPSSATLATYVPLSGSPAGDFLYDLSPLAAGDTFHVELAGSGGTVHVRHYLDGDGSGWLDVGDGAEGTATGVLVRYRLNGEVIGEESAGSGTATGKATWYPGPETTREPDSYHYHVVDGEIIVTVDYDGDEGAPLVQTLGGSWVEPSHVDFVLSGLSVGTTDHVAFRHTGGLPPAFALTQYSLQ